MKKENIQTQENLSTENKAEALKQLVDACKPAELVTIDQIVKTNEGEFSIFEGFDPEDIDLGYFVPEDLYEEGYYNLLEYLQDPEYGGANLSVFKILVDEGLLNIDENVNTVIRGTYYHREVSISPYTVSNSHPNAYLIWQLLDICDYCLRALAPYGEYYMSLCLNYVKPWMILLGFDSPEMESCLRTALMLYGPMDAYFFEESRELVRPIFETSLLEYHYTLRILNLAYLLYTNPQAVKEAFENDFESEKEDIQRNNNGGYFTYLLLLLENRCNEHPLPPEDDDEEDLDD